MNSLIQITKNTINGAEINSVNAKDKYNDALKWVSSIEMVDLI